MTACLATLTDAIHAAMLDRADMDVTLQNYAEAAAVVADAELDRLRGIIADLTATYPLTLSEAQARVDAASKMMEGL